MHDSEIAGIQVNGWHSMASLMVLHIVGVASITCFMAS